MKDNKGAIFVLIASVFFSISGLFIKLIPWNPMAINGARNLIAFFIVSGYAIVTHHKLVISGPVLFGAFCTSITTILYTIATKLTTAANAIVLQFTSPIFVIILMWIIFKKRPFLPEILACCFVIFGISFFVFDGLSSGNMLGDLLSLLSGLTYAGVFMMNSFKKSDALSSVILGNAISALTGIFFIFSETTFNATAVGGIMVLGIFQLGMAYIFMTEGLKRTNAVTASLTSAVEPILNPIFVAVFYHEMISPVSFIGAVIVFVTVMFYNLYSIKKEEA